MLVAYESALFISLCSTKKPRTLAGRPLIAFLYRFIPPLRIYAVKKFCGKCKKELPQDAKYLLCDECHKKVALADDDREFTENSRVHWR